MLESILYDFSISKLKKRDTIVAKELNTAQFKFQVGYNQGRYTYLSLNGFSTTDIVFQIYIYYYVQ